MPAQGVPNHLLREHSTFMYIVTAEATHISFATSRHLCPGTSPHKTASTYYSCIVPILMYRMCTCTCLWSCNGQLTAACPHRECQIISYVSIQLSCVYIYIYIDRGSNPHLICYFPSPLSRHLPAQDSIHVLLMYPAYTHVSYVYMYVSMLM